MNNYAKLCERAARAGGQTLLKWRGRFQVREKGPADLVTEADLASQETVREFLTKATPDFAFLSEEDASDNREVAGHRWIVDPLDGTTNYVHGLPGYAVAVALENGGEVLAGAVYDPLTEECFTAQAGEGAFLNGRLLNVSSVTDLSHALVAASFPAKGRIDSHDIANFTNILLKSQAVRRLGSATLNLSYLAAGRFDAYWATDTKIWDVAAGALLVQEAGGIVTGLDGAKINLRRPRFIAAATRELHDQMRSVIKTPTD